MGVNKYITIPDKKRKTYLVHFLWFLDCFTVQNQFGTIFAGVVIENHFPVRIIWNILVENLTMRNVTLEHIFEIGNVFFVLSLVLNDINKKLSFGSKVKLVRITLFLFTRWYCINNIVYKRFKVYRFTNFKIKLIEN